MRPEPLTMRVGHHVAVGLIDRTTGRIVLRMHRVRLRWYDRLAGRLIALYVLLRAVTG